MDATISEKVSIGVWLCTSLGVQVISPGESQGEGGENIVGWESRGRRD